ncbi:putative ring-like domain-containing protein [Daldinia childiae]|uniref:putative ring-like domain-containing protein n=1 Tax=Daldinia childiae TaxID=326645 RepID=UPI001444DCB9|nr:putative ring-like domain-containing protein [Daldinia childiae]KAF3067094.1 putative ring-like domain-containing protein [Daldinia childiae]
MLEFFTYKKLKKHRDEKAEKQKLEKENDKGKGKEEKPSTDAIHSESPSSPEIILERTEGMPILDLEDEKFLERLTSPSDSGISIADGDETPPPLPPRVKTPVIELDSDVSSVASKDESKQDVPAKNGDGGKGKGKDKEKHKGKDKDKHDGDKPDHKPNRFSFVTTLSRNISLKRKPTHHLSVPPSSSTPTSSSSPSEREVNKEETDIARVLEDLNLAASTDNKAFSLSRESAETLRKFTQVLKDLVNGVPTAYGDLVGLIEDRDGALAKSYDKLPSSLKKLVAQLPEKLTSSLAPELLAVAAEAQGLKGAGVMSAAEGGGGGSKADAVKKLLGTSNLLELVTKPGAVAGLLKGIVNALKTRWPAFVGTNVLWSVAVFLLLSALWYCYKRGRETRLEKEASEVAGTEGVVGPEVLVEGTKEGGNGDVPRIEGVPGQQQQQPTVSVSAPAP